MRSIGALTVLAFVIVGVGAHAAPQQRGRHAGASHSSRSTPRPSVGTHGRMPHRPVAPVIVPFPNVATLSGPLPQGLNPPFGPPPIDLFRVGPRGFRVPGPFYPGFAYGYGAGYADTAPANAAPSAEQAAPAVGLLRLDVTPRSAQVFVDGLYAGTVEDIENRRGLAVAEGPHRIEFRARGYKTDSVDVQVPAHDSITYRGTLDVSRPAAPVARGSSTLYMIPGCYMGNVPPRPERVGAGCDVKNVRVITPQETTGRAAPGR